MSDKDMEKRYLPTSNNHVLNTLTDYIDNLIEEKYPINIETKNTTIKYRNEFIIILEKYIKKDISSYKAQWHLINIL
jgi:hypothetical protein